MTALSTLVALIPILLTLEGVVFGQDLPSAWRTGIATNYGSAYDRMVDYFPSSFTPCIESMAISDLTEVARQIQSNVQTLT